MRFRSLLALGVFAFGITILYDIFMELVNEIKIATPDKEIVKALVASQTCQDKCVDTRNVSTALLLLAIDFLSPSTSSVLSVFRPYMQRP